MKQHGIGWDRSIVANLETGRRASVTVAELCALAWIFDASVLELLMPPNGQALQVTPDVDVSAFSALPWMAGELPPPGHDSATRARWHSANGTVSAYREFRRVFDQAARCESADQESFATALREVARGVEVLARHELACPALPGTWVQLMAGEGWLTDPDAIPVQSEGGDQR
jgi:hypothetical protein